MTTPWLLSTHVADAAIVALADTEASTSTPVANLLTREPWKVWRGTSATSARIMLDLGDVVTVDTLVLCGCTAPVSATMRMSLAATIDDLFWSPTYTGSWESPFSAYAAKPAASLGLDLPAILSLTTGIAAGAVMLEIDAPAGTVALQASRLLAGQRWQPSHGYDLDHSAGWAAVDSVGVAYGGGLVTAARGRQRVRTLPYTTMSTTDRDGLNDIFARLGTWGDLFMNALPDATTRLHREAALVAFAREPTEQGASLWNGSDELSSVRLDFRSFS